MENIERENPELRKRLEALEHMAQKEGIMASGEAPKTMPVAALSSINISGFVQASYFYNTQTPADGKSDGYLWSASHNSFSLTRSNSRSRVRRWILRSGTRAIACH